MTWHDKVRINVCTMKYEAHGNVLVYSCINYNLMKTPERSRTSRVGLFLVLWPQNSLCDVM